MLILTRTPKTCGLRQISLRTVLETMVSGHYVNAPNDDRRRENDPPGQVMFNIIFKISELILQAKMHLFIFTFRCEFMCFRFRLRYVFMPLFYWKILFENSPSSLSNVKNAAFSFSVIPVCGN